MKQWYKPITFHMLQQEYAFSSEELDLLTQRIHEELEYASNEIIRAYEKKFKNTHHNER